MKNITKKQFANSLIWKLCNFIFSKGLTIVISIVLARLLEPSHFGMMAIWSVLLAFCNVIVTGGMDTVLVQKKDLNSKDWSTALVACLCRAVFLYAILFLAAPYISSFYNMPLLSSLIKIASIDFFCQAIITVITAKKMRKMEFKAMFFADLIATISGGFFALYIYHIGLNDLVLVSNVIFHRAIYAVLLYIFDKFSIHLGFSYAVYKSLFKDGYKAMTNGLIDLCSSSLRTLVIGKKWNSIDVGYLERADKYTQTFGVESYNVISDLLLPTFSSYQDDKPQLRAISRLVMTSSCYIMFPLMTGLAICSREIIDLILTQKWIEAAPLMQVMCVMYAVNPIRQACAKVNYAVDRYRANVIIEIIRLCLTVASLAVVWMLKSPEIIMICLLTSIIMLITAFLYLISMKKAIGYSIVDFVRDNYKIIILVCISMVPALVLKLFSISSIMYLLLTVISCFILYVIISAALKIEVYKYMIASLIALVKGVRRDK